MSGGHVEAKKIALRQSKDGIVISFVLHPNDESSALQCLPIGARLMLAWAEIGDDETKAVDSVAQKVERGTRNPEMDGSNPPLGPKPKRAFKDLSLPEQAGIRREDKRFVAFLKTVTPPEWWDIANQNAPSVLRNYLGVVSCADLSKDHDAANRWRALERDYQNWLATVQYADSVNR